VRRRCALGQVNRLRADADQRRALYDLATTRARRWRPAVAAAAVLVGALVYGHVRIGQAKATAEAATKIKVGVVQGNVPFNEKGNEHPEHAKKQLDDLKRLSTELDKAGADLIVWTETAFPWALPRNLQGEPPIGMRSSRAAGGKRDQHFTAPLIFGAITYDVDGTGRAIDKDPYNTAYLLAPDGKYAGRFDKTFLVMFSEHIPLVETFPWIRKLLPRNSGNLTRGEGVEIFPFKTRDGTEVHAAPMICFEDIISAFSIKVGRRHPQVLVNITNDAWFGDTSEPWEHLALAVFRSVEIRAPMVRAVNTGVSAFIASRSSGPHAGNFCGSGLMLSRLRISSH